MAERWWSSSAVARRALAVLMAAIAWLLAGPAEARGTVGVSLDGDLTTADKVFIGTVTGAQTVVARQPGPFGSTVKWVAHQVLVDVALHRSQTGEDVQVLHPVLLPDTAPIGNGFGPVTLKVGTAYLFFVKAHVSGPFELIAKEDWRLVQLEPSALPPLVAVAKRHHDEHDRAVEVLLEVVARCRDRCAGAIHQLASSKGIESPRRRPRRPISPQQKQAQQKAAARRPRFEAALVQVVRHSDHDNTLNAAFTELGRRGVTSVIPRLVRIACQDPKTTKRILSNTVNWLQGFTPAQQIAPLEAIIRHAKDPSVRRYATSRLAARKSQLSQTQ